ncbi:MAG: hypothetical protein NTV42_09665 [Chloroflexi bacterium]|nr:hypothetical protein [Chloroflexota bacterium]
MMGEFIVPHIYINIPYDDLLVYALYSVLRENTDATFENLVVECYTLFPERFGLPGFVSKYPDSAQVEKSWLRCRTDKRLITGNKAQGFKLTARGIKLAEKIQERLGGKTAVGNEPPIKKGDRRTKAGRLVKQLEENNAFKLFQKHGSKLDISDFEFCDLVYSTLDTLPLTRRKNLKQLKDAVTDYNRTDMQNFLIYCESKFTHLLFSENELKHEYSGGMMRRRLNTHGHSS